MTVFERLRTGLKFVLMSMGISSPSRKGPPVAKPVVKPDRE
jgi:hypothetical protein